MLKALIAGILTTVVLFGTICAEPAYAHCQIPCGIFDDQARIRQIEENIATIEKSMKSIIELSQKQDKDYNQIVRWVNNKDTHAAEIEHIVSYYFLAQRVKPADANDKEAYDKYVKQLALLHSILVQSMKAKQTTDLSAVNSLRTALAELEKIYAGK